MNALALPLALVSLFHVSADVVGRAVVSDRTELRRRWSPSNDQPSSGQNAPAFDLENIPSVRGELATRQQHLAAEYAPRFTLRAFDVDPKYELFHSGYVEVGWQDRLTTLTLRETGGYGQNNFSSLAIGTTPAGAPIVQTNPGQVSPCGDEPLRYGTTETTATVAAHPARRWLWTTRADYSASGGLDRCSKGVLPPLMSEELRSELDYATDPRNHVLFGVAGSYTTFSLGQTAVAALGPSANYGLVDGWVGYRHRFSARTEGRVTAGAALLDARLGYQPGELTPYPTAEVSLTRTLALLDNQYALFASVRLTPLVNRVAAIVDERLEERLLLSWTPSASLVTISGSGGATQSIPTDSVSGVKLYTGDLALLYHVTHHLDLDVGARYIYQKTNPTILGVRSDPYDQAIVYVAAVLHDDHIRF